MLEDAEGGVKQEVKNTYNTGTIHQHHGDVIYTEKVYYSATDASNPSERKEEKERAPGTITFGLPARNPYWVDRSAYKEKINFVFSSVPRKLFALHGLGGVGKTQLAHNYLLDAVESGEYALVVKIRAERIDILCADIVQLGEKSLKFTSKCKSKVEKAKEVIAYLDNKFSKKTLILYDNANSFNEVDEFLPKNSNFHILITSRHARSWPRSNSTAVLKMNEAEAVDLLVHTVGRPLKHEDVISLVTEDLDYLPLAIVQAGCYINHCDVSIATYREKYRKSKATLLEFADLPPDLAHSPALTTFDLNFEAIKTKPLALDLLNACAYCYADGITFWFIIALLDIEEDEFNELKRELNKYSLVNFNSENSTASIHRILQVVRQIKNAREEQGDTTLNKLAYWLSINYKYDYSVNFKRNTEFLVHATSIINHLLTEEASQEPAELAKINYEVGLFYLDHVYDAQAAKKYFEKAYSFKDLEDVDARLKGNICRQYAKCLGRLNTREADKNKINALFKAAKQYNPFLKNKILIDKIEDNFLNIKNNRSIKLDEKIELLADLANRCAQLVGECDGDDKQRCQNTHKKIFLTLFDLCQKSINFKEQDISKLEEEIDQLEEYQTRIRSAKEDYITEKRDKINAYDAIILKHHSLIQSYPGSHNGAPEKIIVNTAYLNAKLKQIGANHREALTEAKIAFDGRSNFNINIRLQVVFLYVDLLIKNNNSQEAGLCLNKVEKEFTKKEHVAKIKEKKKTVTNQFNWSGFFKPKASPNTLPNKVFAKEEKRIGKKEKAGGGKLSTSTPPPVKEKPTGEKRKRAEHSSSTTSNSSYRLGSNNDNASDIARMPSTTNPALAGPSSASCHSEDAERTSPKIKVANLAPHSGGSPIHSRTTSSTSFSSTSKRHKAVTVYPKL